MLTKKQKPGTAYLSRLVALPLFAMIVFAFSFRTADDAQHEGQAMMPGNILFGSQSIPHIENDTTPPKKKEISAVDVRKDDQKKVNEITLTYTDGTKESMTGQEAEKRGLINNVGNGNITIPPAPGGITFRLRSDTSGKEPLFILDGKEISKEEMQKIDQNTIQSINVLKDEAGKVKYGDRGKNGVVEIIVKSSAGEAARNDQSKIFVQTEQPASIGSEEWMKFLEQNITPLVEEVSKKAPNGKYTVQVRFVVNTDGSLTDLSLIDEPGYSIGELVLPMMKKAPKWKPAIQNGHPVRSYHTQPITFVISGSAATTSVNSVTPIGSQELQRFTLHQLAGLTSTEDIISCALAIDDDKNDIRVVNNKGNALNDFAKKLLETAIKGNLLTVEEIVVRRNGKAFKMPSKAYKL